MAYGGLCKACIERAITGANCALIGSNMTPAFEPFSVVVDMAGIGATQNRTRVQNMYAHLPQVQKD